MTCGLGTNLGDSKTGTLSLGTGDIPSLILFFEHNGAQHWIESPMTITDPFPPTTGSVDVFALTGEWKVVAKGKNHQDGCTGEGGLGSIEWTATVTLLSS